MLCEMREFAGVACSKRPIQIGCEPFDLSGWTGQLFLNNYEAEIPPVTRRRRDDRPGTSDTGWGAGSRRHTDASSGYITRPAHIGPVALKLSRACVARGNVVAQVATWGLELSANDEEGQDRRR